MKKTKTFAFADLICSIFFIGLSVYAYVACLSFPTAGNTYVQPATFPKIMVVGMLLCSIALFIFSCFKLMRLDTMKPSDIEPAPSLNPMTDKGVRFAGYGTILLILYVLLFGSLGYIIVSFLISLALMLMLGKRNYVQMLLISFFIPAGVWIVFYKMLSVNIPLGPFSFLATIADKI